MKKVINHRLYASFLAICMLFNSAHTLGESAKNSVLSQIRHGICPEGMHYALAILSGGCVALPGIAAESYLKNTYTDIHSSVFVGLTSACAIAGAYSLYKVNQSLSKRTPAAIFKQKEKLQKKIEKLKMHNVFSEDTVLKKLALKFADKVEQGHSVLMNNYITQLLKDIKWINEKLKVLDEPIIEQYIIDVLESARVKIIQNCAFATELKLNKQYQEQEYNNRLTTKIKNSSWWLTKHGVKTSVKASWFLTKVAATMCWDTFKIVLQALVNKIPN